VISDALIMVAGGGLMAVVLLDVLLTVVHLDAEGAIARNVQRSAWVLTLRMAGRSRGVLAVAGPLLIAMTFTVWLVLFILGYALVIWPHLDGSFRAPLGLMPLGFMDAVYHSGVTVTVLGHGDITPLTWPFELLSTFAAASGFALVTGAVTYIVQITSSLHLRIQMALRLKDETGGSGDGVEWLLESLREETLDDTRARVDSLGTLVREVEDRLHRLPMVALLYRSGDPDRDPEPALETIVQLALATRLASGDPRLRRLRPVGDALYRATRRLVADLMAQYLVEDREAVADLTEADDRSRDDLAEIRRRLLEAGLVVDEAAVTPELLGFATRSRHFLDGLDDITGWRRVRQDGN
jgi:hypothetical protein